MKNLLLALSFLALPLAAQNVISAKAGLVHYVEGTVLLNDQPVNPKPSTFSEMKNKDVLRTSAEGRVEILLAPGSFLRLSESSAVRMDSNSLLNTKLTVLEGTALLEVDEFAKDSSLELSIGGSVATVRKAGLYRFEADGAAVKVMQGELAVNSNDELRRVTEGKMITLTGEFLVTKFDKKAGDELSRWAGRRAGYLSMANVVAARNVSTSGMSFNGNSMWAWNSFFNMYTYIPGRGMFYSPFGYSFYSPRAVYAVYNPPVYQGGGNSAGAFGGGDRSNVGFNSGLGYNTSTMRSASGYSGSAGVSAGGGATSGDSGVRGGGAPAGGSSGGRAGGGGTRGQ
jgi:hypothetical protein